MIDQGAAEHPKNLQQLSRILRWPWMARRLLNKRRSKVLPP